MKPFSQLAADTFVKCTGYAYSNLGRLFLRLFVGVMFIQFGIRQLVNYDALCLTFPSVLGMSPSVALALMVIIELVCSTMIMVGFLTRLAAVPPLVSMIIAEGYILREMMPAVEPATLTYMQPGYLPIMFIGFFCFILLAGPGKISLDYFISLFIINRRGKDEAEEMEEV